MMEHTTDRLFWTLTSIIVGALILTIGINAFPKATQGVIQPISGVIKQADTTTHTTDSAANAVMSNDNNSNNSNSNNSSSSQSSTPTDPDAQAKTNAVEASTLGFTMTNNGDGTGTITGYDGKSQGTNLNIPKYVKSNGVLLKITSIGSNNVFFGPFEFKNLTSVTIPNSVTSINKAAFYGNKLTSINIPNSVTTIGDSAFGSNWNVASLTIPNSVTSIGPNAFSYDGLTSITIPNSVTSIGSYAFGSNYSLTSANIPNAQGYQSAKANGAFNFDRVNVTNNPSSN